ncbi:hypothetical protein CCACVL1_10341 [Corchorus capsularis]|uniref:Uncharacterized protein n=1 Tax=Corchorus capsularis TaxID=210143 RepID=A0A1R3IRM8_COCAP|nr:hypothetical protein CCACVL1_10341 [Corchorus capsularis]
MVSKTDETQLNRLENQVDNGGGGAWEYLCLVQIAQSQAFRQSIEAWENKAKEDALKLHGALQKKCNDLEAKFGKLEKDNSALTNQFASLKRSKDEEAGTFEVFKIQMQKEIDDLKVFNSPFLWCFWFG